jgi:hypothetical protein
MFLKGNDLTKYTIAWRKVGAQSRSGGAKKILN